jgi:hypothetical protein
MSPFDVPELETVEDLIGSAKRAMHHVDPNERDRNVLRGQTYAQLALARAIADLANALASHESP